MFRPRSQTSINSHKNNNVRRGAFPGSGSTLLSRSSRCVTRVDCRRQEINLRRRFGLTAAEARLATEVLKGDGRAAAARRRGISLDTANYQLARIFEKTGTHRQTELIRLLLDAANEDKIDRLKMPAVQNFFLER